MRISPEIEIRERSSANFLENLTRQEDLGIYCLECAIRMVSVLRTSNIKLGLKEYFKKCQDISKPFKSWMQKSCKGNTYIVISAS